MVFGNPLGGTPVMDQAPLAALDLPLKILVWRDDDGKVWVIFLAAAWLADRYDIPVSLVPPISAAETLTQQVALGH